MVFRVSKYRYLSLFGVIFGFLIFDYLVYLSGNTFVLSITSSLTLILLLILVNDSLSYLEFKNEKIILKSSFKRDELKVNNIKKISVKLKASGYPATLEPKLTCYLNQKSYDLTKFFSKELLEYFETHLMKISEFQKPKSAFFTYVSNKVRFLYIFLVLEFGVSIFLLIQNIR